MNGLIWFLIGNMVAQQGDGPAERHRRDESGCSGCGCLLWIVATIIICTIFA